jgi:hypothetical protein
LTELPEPLGQRSVQCRFARDGAGLSEDITNLGPTLAEGQQLLAVVEQEVVARKSAATRCCGWQVVPATEDAI